MLLSTVSIGVVRFVSTGARDAVFAVAFVSARSCPFEFMRAGSVSVCAVSVPPAVVMANASVATGAVFVASVEASAVASFAIATVASVEVSVIASFAVATVASAGVLVVAGSAVDCVTVVAVCGASVPFVFVIARDPVVCSTVLVVACAALPMCSIAVPFGFSAAFLLVGASPAVGEVVFAASPFALDMLLLAAAIAGIVSASAAVAIAFAIVPVGVVCVLGFGALPVGAVSSLCAELVVVVVGPGSGRIVS